MVKERLKWTPLSSSGQLQFAHRSEIPFAEPSDYVVLINDWPYGFGEGIVHLLVWSKTPIPVDDVRGDVTPQSRRLIEVFVERYFVREVEGGRQNVLWFKNWVSLQSVRGVDHVHVIVRNVPAEVLTRWTERRHL